MVDSRYLSKLVDKPTQFIMVILSEAAVQKCSSEKVFWKYAANLQESTYVKVWFQ